MINNEQHCHEMVLLSKLRQCFDRFTPSNTTSFVDFLNKNEKHSTVLSGIYRQLYQEGSVNSKDFLQSLLYQANELVTSQFGDDINLSITKKNDFEQLPVSLMCEIGSYLPTKNIFSQWNRVCQKFLEIGYQPQTHKSWDFTSRPHGLLKLAMVKFKLTSLVSKLETVKYDPNFNHLFNLSDTKRAQNIIFCM